jgi:hypothetical protein
MLKRTLWIALAFAAGALAAATWLGPLGESGLGVAPALAGDAMSVDDGQVFVTTDGPNTYLWVRTGDRLRLLGQCARTGEAAVQATFVWMPGVERES